MSKNTLPIVAAVPNYNMGDSLHALLPQLLAENYDHVYVLDDKSTDGSREAVEAFAPEVTFVAGQKNIGAGGNRNRILPSLKRDALIHFLDADVRVASQDIADAARESLSAEATGFVGGLVLDAAGVQTPWNYGPRQSLYSLLGSGVQLQVTSLQGAHPHLAERARKQLNGLLEDWPDTAAPQARRPVFWTSEANLAISSIVFARLGGFDKNLREHDIQDLAIRSQKLGLTNYFDPSLAVTHTDAQVRDYNRMREMRRAERYIARKHGLINWLLPGGHVKPRYNH